MKLVLNIAAIFLLSVVSSVQAFAANEAPKNLRLVLALDKASAETTQQLIEIASAATDLKNLGQNYNEFMIDNGKELKGSIADNYQGLQEDLKINLDLAKPYPKNTMMKTAVITYEHVRFLIVEVPMEALGLMIGIGTELVAPSIGATLDMLKLSSLQLASIAAKSIRFLNQHGYNVTNLKRVSYAIRNSSAIIAHHTRSCNALFTMM